MTTTHTNAAEPSSQSLALSDQVPASTAQTPFVPSPAPTPVPTRADLVQPVLEKLFELYPRLFGGQFLPLKLGVFQELMAAHPDCFERESLKAALGQHTRSTRYLQSVAAGNKRHDLQGQIVEDVAPEHVHFALFEIFRRRQRRTREDLRPKLRKQLIAAFEASGLSQQDYLLRVQTRDGEANALLEQALAEHAVKRAKQEALVRAYESSGQTPETFADMYGLDKRDVARMLGRDPQSQPVSEEPAPAAPPEPEATPDADPA